MSHTLPPDFIREMQALLGSSEAEALCRAIGQTVPPVSLRVNPAKLPEFLPAKAVAEVPWCEEGRYLAERPKFTADPLLHAGCYYVQEASSMFVEQAWRHIAAQATPVRVLDLCAAPGGKSTLWRSFMPDGTLLVANEPVRQRAQILAENLTKWGHPDTIVTQAYPEEFASLGGFFDVIAADVPCSGEGMFRKDMDSMNEWSSQSVEVCAARQWSIIEQVWPALRQGGFLVYSTCTYNRQENEDNVLRICRELGAEPVDMAGIPCVEWGISGDTTGAGLPVFHFFPHRAKGEGFFLALLRKTAASPKSRDKRDKRSQRTRPGVRGGAELAQWLSNDRQFELFASDETHIAAVRSSLSADLQRVCATVQTLSAGVSLAECKGRKYVPQHAIALSSQLNGEAFPRVDVSVDEALAYLRREVLALPYGTPLGYVVVSFQDHPIGFVNNLGSRANNLYPSQWRIRSSYA